MDGSFELSGLRPGRAWIQAVAAEGRSPSTEVLVEENVETPEIELVIAARHRIEGQVVSSNGPVPGALVVATPLQPMASIEQAMTDGAGRFSFEMPDDVDGADVLVLAPSHALASFRVRPRSEPGEALVLSAHEAGGELRVETGGVALGELIVTHDGVRLPARWLARWLGLQGAENTVFDPPLVLPRMAPGEYRVCLRSDPSFCDSTTLVAHGLGWLDVAAKEKLSTASIDSMEVSE